jgi:superfamily II DNA/RNA helicase
MLFSFFSNQCAAILTKVLQLAQAGKDLLFQAKTGTGKTIAFLLPAIDRLLNQHLQGILILVLAPTRETGTPDRGRSQDAVE